MIASGDYWEEQVRVNPAQMAFMLLQAKNKYAIFSRGTGKSYIAATEVDENVRLMPRGITSLTQATIGQALTKTLPSTFKMLESLGYKKYNYNTHTGDYVICRQPPEGFLQPLEHIMNFDHCITFSNGHLLYILTQEGISRGPSVDFNITEKFKLYAGNRFETQFLAGYTYSTDDEGNEVKKAVSSFMDPAYETQVAGVAFIPNDMFSQRLGFANRMTISNGYGFADDKDTEKFEKFKDEPGLESITEFKYAFSNIASFKSRLWAFVNFKGIDEIDGKWENLLAVTLVPYVELQVGYDMAYDKDLDRDAQYKTMVLFGLTWRWF